MHECTTLWKTKTPFYLILISVKFENIMGFVLHISTKSLPIFVLILDFKKVTKPCNSSLLVLCLLYVPLVEFCFACIYSTKFVLHFQAMKKEGKA